MMKFKEINPLIRPHIGKMFEIIGKDPETFDFSRENWYQSYTWSEKQEKEFRDYLVKYLMKKEKHTEHGATSEASWFVLNYGWKLEP